MTKECLDHEHPDTACECTAEALHMSIAALERDCRKAEARIVELEACYDNCVKACAESSRGAAEASERYEARIAELEALLREAYEAHVAPGCLCGDCWTCRTRKALGVEHE